MDIKLADKIEKWEKFLNEDKNIYFSKMKKLNKENINAENQNLIKEIELIKNYEDEEKTKMRFFKDIEFGTGGLRGITGLGTNRMNIYTVARTTQGIANYINSGNAIKNPNMNDNDELSKKYGQKSKSVVISYDSRSSSKIFASVVAEILSANDVDAYLFEEMMPTPTLSFSVRHLKTVMGIMITASHNPAEYNGYKVYDQTGCQIDLEASSQVMEEIDKVDIFSGINWSEGNGKIEYVGKAIYEEYMKQVMTNTTLDETEKKLVQNIRPVYTPLNGVGNIPVRDMFQRLGINKYDIVEEQELPDGKFETCPYPNPEKDEAVKLGVDKCYDLANKCMKEGLENEIPDMLLATDPDSDRIAIICRESYIGKNIDYKRVTGNQVGALILNYLIERKMKKVNNKPYAITTIVSSKIIKEICKKNNVELITTLTGFKFIASHIFQKEKKEEKGTFLMGFEESIGYLIDEEVRDKDAVSTSLVLCEMVAYYKEKGKTLHDVMDDIYIKYGYIKDGSADYYFKGIEGSEIIKNIILEVKNNLGNEFAGNIITSIYDFNEKKYLINNQEKIDDEYKILPKTNCVEIKLRNNSGFLVRPSGTEPKIKFYFSAYGENENESNENILAMKKEVEGIISKFSC